MWNLLIWHLLSGLFIEYSVHIWFKKIYTDMYTHALVRDQFST